MTDREPARLPPEGLPHADLLAELDASKGGDADYRGGKTWSLVYWAGEDHRRLLADVSARFVSENALNPMAFKSLQRLEREVVEMGLGLFKAPPGATGTMRAAPSRCCWR